jgi:alpha-beta hydrolase superfamily lysophospholipase
MPVFFATVLLGAVTALAPPATSTTVPFTLLDNRMLIQATLDGAGPFTMIVDTGSESLVITPSVAQRLGLALRAAGSTGGAGSGSSQLSLSRVESVGIGAMRFDNLSADVIDLSPIQHAIGFPKLDGVIGYSILRKLRAGVDMDDGRLTLSYAPLPAPKTAVSVPFSIEGALISLPASVDGVEGRFIVDTGDRWSLTLFKHFAQANDFYRNALVRNAITGIGIGGPVYSDVLRTSVSLFGSTIPGVVTRASRDRGGVFASGRDDASIGNGLLKRFNIVYDYPDGKMIAWPSRFYAASDRYAPLVLDRGSLRVDDTAGAALPDAPPLLTRHGVFGAAVAPAAGGVRVAAVIPGSAAATAGVQQGDVIRAIDGQPIASVAQFLTATHELQANQHVNAAIVRAGSPVRLSVVLSTAPYESDPGLTTQYGAIPVDDSLRRTLTTAPQALASPAPAVLLIGGIGCYSIDVGNRPQDAYMRLTHDLARAGFVTMRVEKSGVGDSQGAPCGKVDFDAEVRGYAAALNALQHDPQVNPARVYLLGHSIGTIIAPRLASSNRVAGVIVVEAVGRDWPEYEIRNLRRDLELDNETSASTDQALIEKAQCMERLFFEDQSEAVIEKTMPACKAHNGVYPTSVAYMRQVAQLNVIEPWAHLQVPVLAIYGSSDFETELADHQRIVDVVNAAHAGTATLVVIPAMSHGLGRAATPKVAENDDERGVVEVYDTDVSAAIVAWLRSARVAPADRPQHR